MKLKVFFLFAAVGVLVFLGARKPGNNEDKERVLIQALLSGLSQVHIQPVNLDDDFSKKAFDLYLERLDGNKRFFVQSDIDVLMDYRLDIDDQANFGNYEFFNASVKLLNERIAEAESYFNEILKEPFDFEAEDQIEFDSEKIPYAVDKEQLKEYWRKSLKYRTLTRLNDMIEAQDKAKEKGEAEEVKTIAEMEIEAREKELQVHDRWFKRIHQLERKDRLATYLNSITSVYDPHTTYLPPQEKENFDIGMSGRLEGIGARLQSDGVETKVVSIVPGSASWRQGELKVNDIILKVGQAEEEPADVEGMRLDDVVKMVRGKKGTVVKLTVLKADGSKKVIPITRDVVVIEDGYAKSTLLESDNTDDKIGYIYLPRFYADFNKLGGKNSGDDIKNEITKLSDEGAEGIILDLRNNGGGSLNDVIQMAGLFIEKGPIVQVKSRTGKPKIKYDPDPSVHYDGPLVVLVNSGSASASEILAAALQDYQRAIIVGTPTFGKGTVQRFMDLDQAVPSGMTGIKPLGYVKFTTQKFYRINGKTTQLQGVTPDIILPDNYVYLETGEKEYDYAIGLSEIEPADYKELDDLKQLEKIKRASQKRVNASEVFGVIDNNAKWLKKERDDTVTSLNLEDYEAKEAETKLMSDKFENLNLKIEGLKISSLKADMASINMDTTKVAQRENWIKDLSEDVYLNEAILIMSDLMKTEAYAANK
ncbi:MAG: carboxy terminal-processing peptidase [Bacteroidota bacterium]